MVIGYLMRTMGYLLDKAVEVGPSSLVKYQR
jgi:hypothetical protein